MNKRTHLENTKIADNPVLKRAFAVICGLLIVTKATDLEAEFFVDDRQFHIEVTEVKNDPTTLEL